jgi:hypothetical protein
MEDQLAGATFSDCGKYRYKLWRIWDESKPLAMCIGLNPSTANAKTNDNTINILIRVMQQLGYGGFYMMNLFAWISSHPQDLLTVIDPIGENDYYLDQVRKECNDVIACWGAFQQALARTEIVLERFPETKCFGVNNNGTPFHPRALSYKGLLSNPGLIRYQKII